MKNKRGAHQQWSSWLMFVLAATGSAVGLGNIWKFPYVAGQNGGGAFVLVYLLCVALMGIPVMMAEILIGRRGRRNPVNSLEMLAREAGAHPRWRWLGMLGIAAGFLVLSYYSVIAGWTMAYVVKLAAGDLVPRDAEGAGAVFASLIASPWQQLGWHTAFMGITMGIVSRGVQGGLEKAVELLTPALFILLLILVGYAMRSGEFARGVAFLFAPDFGRLSGEGVLTAMGQAFFSLSIAMGAIMTYGSYLPGRVSIAGAAFLVAGADTAVALLAGLAIFPLVFGNHLAPTAGPGLVFQTLPLAFAKMPGGILFGALFFVLLVFAALSSSISLIEPAVAWLVENGALSRASACLWSGMACWAVGLGTVFSFNLWHHITLYGKTFFELLDFLTSNLMLPLGGLLIAVFAGWVMHHEVVRAELETRPGLFKAWWWLIRYLAPGAVGMVFLQAVGIL